MIPADAIITLIVTQTLLKTGYEILILPVTVKVVRRLRTAESGAGITQNVA